MKRAYTNYNDLCDNWELDSTLPLPEWNKDIPLIKHDPTIDVFGTIAACCLRFNVTIPEWARVKTSSHGDTTKSISEICKIYNR